MAQLRVSEAIARAQTNGKKVYKKDVAARLWEGSTESSQQVNMTNLCNGTTKKIAPEWVDILCEMLDCTPNYLFGYEKED
jgi:DNA-binding Xre family transcriptional regulator